MPARKSTVFKSNRSQAVRLPKEMAFPDDVHRVEVVKLGSGRLIVPEGKGWEDYVTHAPRLPDDFPDDIEDMPPRPVEGL